MDILEKIVAQKRREVALKKQLIPLGQLESSILFDRQTTSLANALLNSSSGIIAEFKRRSPSKSVINQETPIQEVAKGYQDAGVCGMSVLTDNHFFGGSLDDLLIARSAVHIPLLRKEFIIDTYQIIEAKAHGADVILLIAAILNRNEIEVFSELAGQLGMEVLLEVHDGAELQRSLVPGLTMIGVNNRNLKTFEVSLETSRSLAKQIPSDIVMISESGLSSPEAIVSLREEGFRGFLVGESFMASRDPGASAAHFIKIIGS